MMKKFLLLLVLLIVAGLVTIYTYLDFIAEKAIEKYGLQALGVPVTVDKISVKLQEGKFTFKNVKIKNPEGFKYENAIEIAQLSSQIDLRTIFKDVIVIHSIAIDNPNIFYEIGENGDNIKALKKNTSAQKAAVATADKTAKQTGEEKNKKVMISKLFLNKAKVNAVVEHLTEKSITLPDIYIQNIGKDSNGVTIANATDQVLRELTKAISKANVQSLIDDILNLPQNIDGLKEHMKDKIDGFTSDVNKLFSK
jgi:hypothetical protein